MSSNTSDPNDYPIFQIDATDTGPIYINGINAVPGGTYPNYSPASWSYVIPNCRLCGEQNQASIFPQVCFVCLSKVMDKVIKDIIPNTTEYCQDCFSHFKACKCPKKEAMDKLKS